MFELLIFGIDGANVFERLILDLAQVVDVAGHNGFGGCRCGWTWFRDGTLTVVGRFMSLRHLVLVWLFHTFSFTCFTVIGLSAQKGRSTLNWCFCARHRVVGLALLLLLWLDLAKLVLKKNPF